MLAVSIEGVRRNFGICSVYMYSVTLIAETGQHLAHLSLLCYLAVAERRRRCDTAQETLHFVASLKQKMFVVKLGGSTLEHQRAVLQDLV